MLLFQQMSEKPAGIWHDISSAIKMVDHESYRIRCVISDAESDLETTELILRKRCFETGGEDGGDILVSEKQMQLFLEKMKRKYPAAQVVKIADTAFAL